MVFMEDKDACNGVIAISNFMRWGWQLPCTMKIVFLARKISIFYTTDSISVKLDLKESF